MAIEWNFSLVNKDRYIILVKHELGEGREGVVRGEEGRPLEVRTSSNNNKCGATIICTGCYV